MAVGGLTWMGWVTINFGKIDKDLLGVYQKAKKNIEDKGLVQRYKRILTKTVPLMSGFSAGFYYGFETG